MKIIKVAIVAIIIILLLNSFGLLSKKNSIRVDEAVETVKTKISEMEYKDKPIIEMSLKELSSSISTDITYLKEDVLTDDGIVFKGKGIVTTINPGDDTFLVAKVDPSEPEAVESIEKLLSNLTMRDIKIPEIILGMDFFTVTLEKVNGEYSIRYN